MLARSEDSTRVRGLGPSALWIMTLSAWRSAWRRSDVDRKGTLGSLRRAVAPARSPGYRCRAARADTGCCSHRAPRPLSDLQSQTPAALATLDNADRRRRSYGRGTRRLRGGELIGSDPQGAETIADGEAAGEARQESRARHRRTQARPETARCVTAPVPVSSLTGTAPGSARVEVVRRPSRARREESCETSIGFVRLRPGAEGSSDRICPGRHGHRGLRFASGCGTQLLTSRDARRESAAVDQPSSGPGIPTRS